jgi:hypothetical protein
LASTLPNPTHHRGNRGVLLTQAMPVRVTPYFFSERIDSVSDAASRQAVDALHTAALLSNEGLLLEDPRSSEWREAIASLELAKGDSLAPDQSPVAEVSAPCPSISNTAGRRTPAPSLARGGVWAGWVSTRPAGYPTLAVPPAAGRLHLLTGRRLRRQVLNVAWAQHELTAEWMTATLTWFDTRGQLEALDAAAKATPGECLSHSTLRWTRPPAQSPPSPSIHPD